jgi:hypothetical protein
MDLLTLVLDLGRRPVPDRPRSPDRGRPAPAHHRAEEPTGRVREALIHYAEDRLKEARGRERQFSEKIGALSEHGCRT